MERISFPFVEQHHDVARLESFQNQFAFLFLLHFLGEALGILQFGNHFQVERQVAFCALHVVADGGNEMGLNGFPYDE